MLLLIDCYYFYDDLLLFCAGSFRRSVMLMQTILLFMDQ